MPNKTKQTLMTESLKPMYKVIPMDNLLKEEFEDAKGVIRIRKSKNTMVKRTNNDIQNMHIKVKIE